MSHHFDWPIPGIPGSESQDISDVHCFAGPSDDDGPRTVIGMNASPQRFEPTDLPWDPRALYELKLDLNDDFVEDITWRFTFPSDSTGTQYVRIAQLNGPDATSRTAPGGDSAALWRRRAAGSPVPARGPTAAAAPPRTTGSPACRMPGPRTRHRHRRTAARQQAFQITAARSR